MAQLIDTASLTFSDGATAKFGVALQYGEQYATQIQRLAYGEGKDISGHMLTARAVPGAANINSLGAFSEVYEDPNDDKVSDRLKAWLATATTDDWECEASNESSGLFQVLLPYISTLPEIEYNDGQVPVYVVHINHRDAALVDIKEMRMLVSFIRGSRIAVAAPEDAAFPDTSRIRVDYAWESELQPTGDAPAPPPPTPAEGIKPYALIGGRPIAASDLSTALQDSLLTPEQAAQLDELPVVLVNANPSADSVGKLIYRTANQNFYKTRATGGITPATAEFETFVDANFLGNFADFDSLPAPANINLGTWAWVYGEFQAYRQIRNSVTGNSEWVDIDIQRVLGAAKYVSHYPTDAEAIPHVTAVGDLYFNDTVLSMRRATAFTAASGTPTRYEQERLLSYDDIGGVISTNEGRHEVVLLPMASPSVIDKNSIPPRFVFSAHYRRSFFTQAARYKINFLGQDTTGDFKPGSSFFTQSVNVTEAMRTAIAALTTGSTVTATVTLENADGTTEFASRAIEFAVVEGTAGVSAEPGAFEAAYTTPAGIPAVSGLAGLDLTVVLGDIVDVHQDVDNLRFSLWDTKIVERVASDGTRVVSAVDLDTSALFGIHQESWTPTNTKRAFAMNASADEVRRLELPASTRWILGSVDTYDGNVSVGNTTFFFLGVGSQYASAAEGANDGVARAAAMAAQTRADQALTDANTARTEAREAQMTADENRTAITAEGTRIDALERHGTIHNIRLTPRGGDAASDIVDTYSFEPIDPNDIPAAAVAVVVTVSNGLVGAQASSSAVAIVRNWTRTGGPRQFSISQLQYDNAISLISGVTDHYEFQFRFYPAGAISPGETNPGSIGHGAAIATEIVDWFIGPHDDGGLDEDQVNALIQEPARTGSTTRWPKNKLPTDTVYSAAISAFRTATQIMTTAVAAARARFTDAEKTKLAEAVSTTSATAIADGRARARYTDTEKARVAAIGTTPSPVIVLSTITQYDATANRFEDSSGAEVVVPDGVIVTLTNTVYQQAVADSGFTPNPRAVFLVR